MKTELVKFANNLFVSYDIAVSLKKLGFDEECFAWWNGDDEFRMYGWDSLLDSYLGGTESNPNAPTYQQVLDWFRSKYKLHVHIFPRTKESWRGVLTNFQDYVAHDTQSFIPGTSYEEIKEETIKKLIELVDGNKIS